MGKIAILGGTFDPVHWGHLLVAQAAASQFALDRIIWMPDRVPPHKSRPDLAGFDRRREMVAAAIADRPDFVLAPLEANPPGTSFAIHTLLYLKNLYPEAQRYWIVGADAFQTLPKWHRCCEIGGLCDWLVAPRPPIVGAVPPCPPIVGAVPSCPPIVGAVSPCPPPGDLLSTSDICRGVAEQMAIRDAHIRWQVLAMPSIGISSSLIRRYCARSRSIRYLVPEAVRTYIARHRLYRI
jgi:nicotinate-nucleotide adenylyltransferase